MIKAKSFLHNKLGYREQAKQTYIAHWPSQPEQRIGLFLPAHGASHKKILYIHYYSYYWDFLKYSCFMIQNILKHWMTEHSWFSLDYNTLSMYTWRWELKGASAFVSFGNFFL